MFITQEDIDFAKCLEKESVEELGKYAEEKKLDKFLETWNGADAINRKAILYKLISINRLVNAKLKSKANRWLKKHRLPN